MRAFFIECYFFRFKHKKIRLWCFLHSTGDETLKKSFASGFLFDENCRIRGPPSQLGTVPKCPVCTIWDIP